MNRHAPLVAGAAALLTVGVLGYFVLPKSTEDGGRSSIPPSAASALLARGTFTLNGARVVLDATGAGADVSGTMTGSYEGGDFSVDLKCAQARDDGLLSIGGDVTKSTDAKYALTGTRTGIVFKRGSPPLAEFVFQMTDPPAASCIAFLDDMARPLGQTLDFQPITGSVELAP